MRVLELHCELGPRGASAVGLAMRQWPSLVNLNLCFGGISDEGLISLAAELGACRRLERLVLVKNSISDAGAVALADALQRHGPFLRLEVLDLGSNRISARGAEALACALAACHELYVLGLRGNNIELQGASGFLGALVGLPFKLWARFWSNPGFSQELEWTLGLSLHCRAQIKALLAGALASSSAMGLARVARPASSGAVAAEPAVRFVRRDGDNAVMRRVLRWLDG